MRYTDVCLEAISYVLPGRVVSSATVEKWLKPLYDRLHLPEGRLELMTGIRERRFWDPDTLPSEVSAMAGRQAMSQADVGADEVDCLLHCSVSRDFVEPATSTAVHRLLQLPSRALNFDISNACLGALSGVIMLANMIQLGQVEAGLVVAGEHAEPLVRNTVTELANDTSLTRQSLKPHFASLTIGSAAAAILLTHRSRSRTKARLAGGAHAARTDCNHLCRGTGDAGVEAAGNPQMQTNSEELLIRGVELAEHTWSEAKRELGWTNESADLICCHQVSRMHRQRLYESLHLDMERDYSTFEFLGNCGAASLPATAAMAMEAGRVRPGQRLALLGIGSGINCTMLGVEC